MKRGFRKELRGIFFVLIILLSLSLVSAVDKVPEEIKSCSQDSDCMLVENRNGLCSCNCFEGINKKYEREYDHLEFDSCDVILCEPCSPPEYAIARCVNNICIDGYSDVVNPDYVQPIQFDGDPIGNDFFFWINVFFYGGIAFIILVVVAIVLLTYFIVKRKNKLTTKRKLKKAKENN